MRLLLLLGILVVWGMEYASVRTAGFVFEDNIWNAACEPDQNPQPMPKSWRAIPRSLAQGSWCWQVTRKHSALAFHLVNMFLHGLVSLVLCLLAYELTGREAIAWTVGTLFLVHPLAIESAGYAAGRGELIAALGVMLACLAAVKGRWLLMFISVGFGILGKETALVAGLLIPLLLVYQDRMSSWLASLIIGLILSIILAATIRLQLVSLPAKLWVGWAFLQAAAFVRMLALAVVPWGQTPTHDYTQLAFFWKVLAMAGFLALAVRAWTWENRLAAFGLGWVLLTSVPRFLVPTPYSPLNEHQFYVPLMGLGFVLASYLQPAMIYDRANCAEL